MTYSTDNYIFGTTTEKGIEHTLTNTIPLVDPRGRYRVRTLFLETMKGEEYDTCRYQPVWTLTSRPYTIRTDSPFYKPDRYPTILPSLHQLYVESGDPTEYLFALKAFGSFEHWEYIKSTSALDDYLPAWQRELKAKIEGEAILAARRVARDGEGAQALNAAKWLHSVLQPKNTKGRPSKEEVTKEAKRQAQSKADLQDDIQRLGL